MKGEKRFYRHLVRHGRLTSFHVQMEETDLQICATSDLSNRAGESIINHRQQLQSFIREHPEFLTSLAPLSYPHPAPPIVRDMLDAGRRAGVGPMAAVAGAMAARVGADLLRISGEVIVENGGDIFLKTADAPTIGIFAGKSPLSLKIGIKLPAMDHPAGVCTSSGTVGHSLSMGRADGVCIFADNCALADAAATAVGNRVKTAADIPSAIYFGRSIPDVRGIVVIVGEKIGAWGELEIVPLAIGSEVKKRNAGKEKN